jgi:hypothetical protein
LGFGSLGLKSGDTFDGPTTLWMGPRAPKPREHEAVEFSHTSLGHQGDGLCETSPALWMGRLGPITRAVPDLGAELNWSLYEGPGAQDSLQWLEMPPRLRPEGEHDASMPGGSAARRLSKQLSARALSRQPQGPSSGCAILTSPPNSDISNGSGAEEEGAKYI